MDHFGIGAAMLSMTSTYSFTARRTGRTLSLVESVKDGDRLVFADQREAKRVEILCRDRGVKVDCIVIPPKELHRLGERGTSEGRTIFDHSWVEQFYFAAIEQAQGAIDHWQRETSGYGAPHRETRRKAEELGRWPAYKEGPL